MSNQSYKIAVNNIYKEREDSIILGLTGRTGSGCSTIASILNSDYAEIDLKYTSDLDERNISEITNDLKSEEKKFHIINNYIKNRWQKFTIIEASAVIFAFVLKEGFDHLIRYIDSLRDDDKDEQLIISNYEDFKNKIKNFEPWFKEAKSLSSILDVNSIDSFLSSEELEILYNYYINDVIEYRDRFRNLLNQYSCKRSYRNYSSNISSIDEDLYSTLWQRFGNNIRSSGNPFDSSFKQDRYLVFGKAIGNIISLIKEYNKTINSLSKNWICIDAIRNSYESNYLKTRYREFYLLAISTDESDRREHFDMSRSARNILDNNEYSSKSPKEQFYRQDLSKCFENADIHIYNRNDLTHNYLFTKWQLIRYISLMIHPGLITPSHMERCMQLAYITKMNSGCLSRQVGAIVTGEDYSIKSVGWNDVPHGQISCNLRNVEEYCSGCNPKCYSRFELEDEDFAKAINGLNAVLSNSKGDKKNDSFKEREYAYCFKDIYNGIKNAKNQVHTRALHAEENAFLQISKYGGEGLRNGILFSTASPCELCSKKAYQIGIRTIIFIDPYPGISKKHILSFGRSRVNPVMKQYYGAIGDAYIQLYRQIMPVKDELELIEGINTKKIVKESIYGEEKENRPLDFLIHTYVFRCRFINRLNIEAIREVSFTVNEDMSDTITKSFRWTGTAYNGTNSEGVYDENGKNILDVIEEIQDDHLPYRSKMKLTRKLKKGDRINYTSTTKVMDFKELMKPYVAKYISHPTESLIIKLEFPKDSNIIDKDSIRNHRYASSDLSLPFDNPKFGDEKIEWREEENMVVYELKVDNPNLFYNYSIEWSFIQAKENQD